MKRLLTCAKAFAALVALVMFTACGGKIATTLTLDSSGKGQRVMDVTMDFKDISRFEKEKPSAEQIDAAIKKHLPAELTYSGITSDGDTMTGSFTMSFSDLNDYRKKAASLIAAGGSQAKVSIEFSQQGPLIDTPLLKESFSLLIFWIGQQTPCSKKAS